MSRACKFWLPLQILLDTPTQDNYIAIPDGSGIFVIDALEPLFIDTSGNVYLAQDLIVHVGQLVAGSIGRSFGKLSALLLAWEPLVMHAWAPLLMHASLCTTSVTAIVGVELMAWHIELVA